MQLQISFIGLVYHAWEMGDGTLMDKAELLGAWQALGDRVLQVATSMSDKADPQSASNGEEWWVKLWALALLCRTTNHFAGMKLLLTDRLIVEARTLVRCCYENLFRISYLDAEGYAAVKVWISDSDAHTKVVGKALQAWSRKQKERVDGEEFDRFMEELEKRETKKAGGFEAQAASSIKDHYISYRMLSADSAHPTLQVVSRHARIEADDSLTLSGASLWVNDDEELETWSLGCEAFLRICMYADHLLDLGCVDDINQCAEECGRLNKLTIK